MAPNLTHIVAPIAPHTHTIIFLHGRGSDAKTFPNEIFESQDSSERFFPDVFPSVKWVFPCAKQRWAKTDREEMHQWFDMSSVQRPQEDTQAQKPELWESISELLELLSKEAEIVRDNIILAGISQGCATAIIALLSSGLSVGGFFGLCGWLPLANELEGIFGVSGKLDDVRQTLILLQHCHDDGVVPFENGQQLAQRLKTTGMQVRWEPFEDGGHWLNEPKGMDGIVRFVEDIMKCNKNSPS